MKFNFWNLIQEKYIKFGLYSSFFISLHRKKRCYDTEKTGFNN